MNATAPPRVNTPTVPSMPGMPSMPPMPPAPNAMKGGRRGRRGSRKANKKGRKGTRKMRGGQMNTTTVKTMGGTQQNKMMGGQNKIMGGQNKMMGGGAVGSKAQVWHGTARKTVGGLTKKDLMKHKGRIISRKKHALGKKALKNLIKAGYKAKKGTFKLFKK